MAFQRAVRKNARLRLAITGASGSGKTWAALEVAAGLGGKTALIDTEHDSASLYADDFIFDSEQIAAPYSPERFISKIKEAESSGYDNLIIDSLSHEWIGVGGCLNINDKLAETKYKGNSWSAWNETTPRHRALLDTMLASPLHIIVTLRSKTETVQGEGKRILKLGMKSEMRDGFEYEFTIVLDLDHSTHEAIASKDRTKVFSSRPPEPITQQTGKLLVAWMAKGAPLPFITAERFEAAIGKLLLGEITAGVLLANFTLTDQQDQALNAAIDQLKPIGAIA